MDRRKIINFCIILIWIYLIAILFITSHEAIHYYIFARYEVDAKINLVFFPLPKGIVVPIGNYQNCNDFCKFQHALNDIVGYNLVVLIFVLFGLTIFHKFGGKK